MCEESQVRMTHRVSSAALAQTSLPHTFPESIWPNPHSHPTFTDSDYFDMYLLFAIIVCFHHLAPGRAICIVRNIARDEAWQTPIM